MAERRAARVLALALAIAFGALAVPRAARAGPNGDDAASTPDAVTDDGAPRARVETAEDAAPARASAAPAEDAGPARAPAPAPPAAADDPDEDDDGSDAATLPAPAVPLRLEEAIATALAQNFDVRGARAGRLSQRYALHVAHNKFWPHFSLGAQAGRGWPSGPASLQDPNLADVQASPHVEWLLPTGTMLQADLTAAYTRPATYGQGPYSGLLALTVAQPLLRDAGLTVNRASVEAGDQLEQQNQRRLEAQLVDTVSAVILAYRDFAQASTLEDIARHAVERSRGLLGIDHQMVAAGRLARADLIQVESEIATREANLVSAQSDVVALQAALLQLLAVRADTSVTPVPEPMPSSTPPGAELARRCALQHRPDYRAALAAKEVAARALVIAENGRRWDLRLTATHRRGGASTAAEPALLAPFPAAAQASSTFVGLQLALPLIDVLLQQKVVDGQVGFLQAELAASRLRVGIDVEIDAARRTVLLQQRLYQLSRRARRLAERKLANEREKLGAGRSSNFLVLRYVDDLVVAETAEVRALTAYRNSRTALEQRMGGLAAQYVPGYAADRCR